MQTFKEGDKVSVLHETIVGCVVSVKGNIVQIEDEDGFIRAYPISKLVPSASKADYKIGTDIPLKDIQPNPVKRPVKKVVPRSEPTRTEIDLHIEELRDSHHALTNYEIVQIQMTACRAFVMDAIAQNKKRIVLIHGKGEGVLKSEIHHYLDRLASNQGVRLDYHDASYRSYGMGGATEVVFNNY